MRIYKKYFLFSLMMGSSFMANAMDGLSTDKSEARTAKAASMGMTLEGYKDYRIQQKAAALNISVREYERALAKQKKLEETQRLKDELLNLEYLKQEGCLGAEGQQELESLKKRVAQAEWAEAQARADNLNMKFGKGDEFQESMQQAVDQMVSDRNADNLNTKFGNSREFQESMQRAVDKMVSDRNGAKSSFNTTSK